jgi:hypothetical protein
MKISDPKTPPVLFIIFNRPDSAARVFEAIRQANPQRLYVAADGPRDDRPWEKELCERTRSIIKKADWDCRVLTLFRDLNLGCGKAVSEAVSWFFGQEKEGIILEDDCLPHPSFFKFCSELLSYYRDNKRVMHISGDQYIKGYGSGASYYFTKIQHCWGWASWADRWANYDFSLRDYDEKNIEKFSERGIVRRYWKRILKRMRKNEIDTWDHQWTFKIVELDGLCINPTKNLVSNIGFGEDCTHTSYKESPFSNMPVYDIGEIVHPSKIEADTDADEYIYRHHYYINNLAVRIIKKLLKEWRKLFG